MITTWKYALSDSGTVIAVPKGAKLLTIQVQRSVPCLWFLVDTNAEKEERTFRVFDTGAEIVNHIDYMYIGAYQSNDEYLVFHVFEKIRPTNDEVLRAAIAQIEAYGYSLIKISNEKS